MKRNLIKHFTKQTVILILLVMTVSQCAFGMETKSQFDLWDYGRKMALLVDAGIIEDGAASDMTMTRGEFAYLMTKVLGFYDMETEKCNTAFTDVTERTPYSKAIDTICDMGLIKGN